MNVKDLPRVLLCCAALALLAACKEEARTSGYEPIVRPVLSMVVADVETVRRSTYPGRAIAFQELNIGFEVPGKVLARPVDVGSIVRTGDVLATLDTEPTRPVCERSKENGLHCSRRWKTQRLSCFAVRGCLNKATSRRHASTINWH